MIAPVVMKTYDFIQWIVPKLEKFPRSQRFLLGDRIQTTLLDVLEGLIEASYTKDKVSILNEANLKLEKLRFLIRLSKDMRYLSVKHSQFASERLLEIGKMLGGWRKERQGNSTLSH